MHRMLKRTTRLAVSLAAICLLTTTGCGWTRPAREALLTLATDYHITSRSDQGITIDYDPASIDGTSLAPIAEREAHRYGKTARPGPLMVSHHPRVNQQHFEFIDR